MLNAIDKHESLADFIREHYERIDHLYPSYLDHIPNVKLKKMLQACLSNKGKRLRPLLIYAVGLLFDASLENLDIAALAIELIHTYSLIHDDLPCMDNADLRRGQPTCHIMYGEAMAVLGGDAFLTLVMQIIAMHPAALTFEKRNKMIQAVSVAAGAQGMIVGQVNDLEMLETEISSISLNHLLTTYHLKTGKLFTACSTLAYLASRDADEENLIRLHHFSNALGLAFQIQDDVLDIIANQHITGKTHGLDQRNKKISYASIEGIQAAREKIQALYQEALVSVAPFGEKAQVLRELTGWVLAGSL